MGVVGRRVAQADLLDKLLRVTRILALVIAPDKLLKGSTCSLLGLALESVDTRIERPQPHQALYRRVKEGPALYRLHSLHTPCTLAGHLHVPRREQRKDIIPQASRALRTAVPPWPRPLADCHACHNPCAHDPEHAQHFPPASSLHTVLWLSFFCKLA
ncbi:hypothetical protein EBI_27509 [Enterocytozoon bieneusi H348]|nr:hypothetical protein EBI_27509 [Enterocytozoon bieneusi H348]|eukprot:XP_002652333.1 hypothetical protein EBI_27509 [Enterocytozoon bieneusi H348]